MAMVRGRSTVELIRESALGDELAITELVQEMAPEFLAFVAKRSHCDPEYIVNEVLANVLRRLPDLDIPSENEFRAYVYRSLRNRLADEGRRAAVATVPIDALAEGAAPTVEFESDVVRRLSMSALLDRLTPAQRAVISSRFLHGLSLEETAVRVGKPVRSVKALQSRGLRSLRVAAGVIGVVAVLVLGLLVFRSRVDSDLQPVDTNGGQIEPDRGDGTDDGGRKVSGDGETETDGTLSTVDVDNGGGVSPPVGGPIGAVTGFGSNLHDRAGGTLSGDGPTGAGTSLPASAGDPGGSGPGAGGSPSSPASPGTTVVGGPVGAPVPITVPGGPTTAPAPAPTPAPVPSTTVTAAPVSAPRCLSVEGSTVITEGTTTSYRLLFDKAATYDRTWRVNVTAGTAAWVANPAGLDNQDIMWGGYYTTWLVAPLLPPVQTGTIYGKVLVPGNGLLGLLSTDHPMVGPADATWDYSLLSGGVIQTQPFVDVRVPAGALLSDPIEVRAHKEKVTIDVHGNHVGYEESGESFGLGTGACSTTISIVNASTQVFVNNTF